MRVKRDSERQGLLEESLVEVLEPILLRQHWVRSNPDVGIHTPPTEWGRPEGVMNLVMISIDGSRLQDLDQVGRVCSKTRVNGIE